MQRAAPQTPQMRVDDITPAVVYARVSSVRQTTDGDGLGSQEKRCRDYAAAKGYVVIQTFTDSLTGATEHDMRPGFARLIAYAVEYKAKNGRAPVVLMDDIKRVARDVDVHRALRKELKRVGARLEGPLLNFEDTPEGRFVETVMAAQAELERDQNTRQVLGRMRARVEQGFWTFSAPFGYRYKKHELHKHVLVPDGRRADVVREMLEGFASGRFYGISDAEQFLSASGVLGEASMSERHARLTKVRRILERVLYTGYVEYAPWGISLRKGVHEPLISLATFERIKLRLSERATIITSGKGSITLPRSDRVTDTPDYPFPLRGLVSCAECGRLLTASFSRGKLGKRYPYYHCPNRDCAEYGKTTGSEVLEREVGESLKSLTVQPHIVEMAEAQTLDAVKDLERTRMAEREALNKRLGMLEKDIQNQMEKIAASTSAAVMRLLEEKVERLSDERDRVRLLVSECQEGNGIGQQTHDVGTLFSTFRNQLESPYHIYKSGDSATRRMLVRAAFQRAVSYRRGIGVGTPRYTLPYLLTTALSEDKFQLVGQLSQSWNYDDMIPEVLKVLNNWPKFKNDPDNTPE